MALKSTIYKATLAIADIDRGYYADHALTIARHPSENDERMMVRLVAFVLHASERLAFGKGLSDPDDPDLVERDLTGHATHWIEVGQPDERALRKACGKADAVTVLAYASTAAVWWAGIANAAARMPQLAVQCLPADQSRQLVDLAERTMHLQCSVQDGSLWIGDARRQVQLDVQTLRAAAGR